MQNIFKALSPAAMLLLVSTQAVSALPGESFVLNQNTGDYTITYWDYPNSPKRQLRQVTLVPSTKVEPIVKSKVRFSKDDGFAYFYSVSNGAASRQSIVAVRFDPVSDIASLMPLPKNGQDVDPVLMEQSLAAGRDALITPVGWNGSCFTSQTSGLRVSWSYASLRGVTDGLKPGNSQSGFGFSSNDLPSIGTAQISGHAPVTMWPDEGPDGDIAMQLESVERKNFVPRFAAVPAIAIPNPFDPALLLDRIRTEMQTWPGKQLLDAAYSAKLDGYLASAANAFRMNQPKAARDQIEAVRKLLSKEHHNIDHDDEDDEDTEEHKRATRFTIDRLAARVLDFDLRYVLKRTEREHEKRDKHEHKKR